VLDRDVLAGDNDSFQEKPYESQAAPEVGLVEPRAQGLGVLPDALATGAAHLVAGDLLGASAGCVAGGFEAFAACLQLIHGEGATP
jgi:hypothetical protein